MVVNAFFHVKLVDFGVSKCIEVPRTPTVGTHGYMAPEVFTIYRRSYTTQADLYSLGCVMARLNSWIFSGFPAPNLQRHSAAQFIEDVRKFNSRRQHGEAHDRFIFQLLRTNAEDRGTARALLEHPWILS